MNKLYKIYVSSDRDRNTADTLIFKLLMQSKIDATIYRNKGTFEGQPEPVNYTLEILGTREDRLKVLALASELKALFNQKSAIFTMINADTDSV